MPILELAEIGKSFVKTAAGLRQRVQAVNSVSLSLNVQETIGLIGESGSGKSTLGRIAAGLELADSGRLTFQGIDLAGTRKRIPYELRGQRQMVFQNPHASLNPRLTICYSLAEPLHALGWEKRQIARRISELLDQVAMPQASLDKYPHQFSGGQLQRIAIGRAIAAKPAFIVADEPVASLDMTIQAQILELFHTIQQETGVSYLFIGHGLQAVRYVADRIAVMLQGQIVELADVEPFFRQPRHPYSKALLAASPVPDPTKRRISAAGADEAVGSSEQASSGCPYLAQCPVAMSRCRAEMPVIQQVAEGHEAACFAAVPDQQQTSPLAGSF